MKKVTFFSTDLQLLVTAELNRAADEVIIRPVEQHPRYVYLSVSNGAFKRNGSGIAKACVFERPLFERGEKKGQVDYDGHEYWNCMMPEGNVRLPSILSDAGIVIAGAKRLFVLPKEVVA